jgi:hypothetical protein
MSDSDADEYIYLGTPLQGSGQVAVPVNQQTVRDAAGRQRLHGAFTGGYSAGFYNTVGSQVSFCLLTVCKEPKSWCVSKAFASTLARLDVGSDSKPCHRQAWHYGT